MSWTTVGPGTETWTGTSATAKSWSGSTVGLVPPAWGILSAVTGSDDGVDFCLRVRENYPIRVSADRPAIIRDTHETP